MNTPQNSALAPRYSLAGMPWARAALLLAAFVYACLPALRALMVTWSVQDVYSYGYLVPVAAVLWIWHDRDRFVHLPVKPALPGGLVVVSAGGLMLVFGSVGGSSILQELAVVVIIPGLMLMLFGTQYLRFLALPLSYLILMVPFLDGLVASLHEPLQLFAATTAVKLLHLVNVPVFQSGKLIELPNATLEVANACSGVRFLISTVVLSIPLAFISQKGWLPRVLLVLFAIALSIGANPIRVTLVALWAYYGDGDIHGPLHIFQGYVVYLFIMGLLFLMAWFLRKMPVAAKQNDQQSAAEGGTRDLDSRQLKRAITVALLTLLVIGSAIQVAQPEPVPLARSLNELPLVIGDWKHTGTVSMVSPLSPPGADEELVRIYRNAAGGEITLSIAYFSSQRPDKKLVYYKLQALQEKGELLVIPQDAKDAVRVNKTVLHEEGGDTIVASWYDLNGRIIVNQYMAKAALAVNGIFHRRTNGAVIIVSSAAPSGGSERSARELASFIQQVLPVLKAYIP
jgi:EpsI family protein